MKKLLAFTLIEIIITIGIMSLITSVVLYNSPKFNQNVLMNRAARDFASTIRDAQNRASAVVPLPSQPGISDPNFPTNYGLAVRIPASFYKLFSDGYRNTLPGTYTSRLHDGSGGLNCNKECIQRYDFQGGVRVKNILYPAPSPALPGGFAEINILFYRPDPTTKIVVVNEDPPGSNNRSSACTAGCPAPGSVTVILANKDDTVCRQVQIWTTGQVSILAPTTPSCPNP